MELVDLVTQMSGFESSSPREKIQLLGWYLHTHKNKETFVPSDIKACLDKLHLEQVNIAQNLTRLAERSPPDLLKQGGAFKLARSIRLELDKKYGVHHSIVAVSKLLADLPAQVPNIEERVFLQEALRCYRVEAYRACVVMMWNLAFDHLLRWILSDAKRLAAFNAAIAKKYPKRANVVMAHYDDFADEFKEFEVIEVCNVAQTVNSNIIKILKEKLVKRNLAAHPSSVIVVQAQADDVVTDLVNNVVLALT